MTDQQIEMLRLRGQLGRWVAPVGGDHRPPQEPFLQFQTLYEADPDPQGGRWYAASCIGLLGADRPTEPLRLNTPPAAAVDPSQVALRALARITLRAPQLRLIPPVAGSVPLGMPVWLTVGEPTQAWGPVEDGPFCEGPDGPGRDAGAVSRPGGPVGASRLGLRAGPHPGRRGSRAGDAPRTGAGVTQITVLG